MRKMASIMYCDFCAKHQDEVKTLLSGINDAAICNECVSVAVDIISKHAERATTGNATADDGKDK